MFDVLPPSVNAADADAFSHNEKKKKRRARMLSSSAHIKPPAPRVSYATPTTRVVQVNWKLPARLRKPIRQQLHKERQEREQREAIVRFNRRPLDTKHILERRSQTLSPVTNKGAEHHTGDVYSRSRPNMRVALPPYAGSFSNQLLSSSSRPQLPPAKLQGVPIKPAQKISPRRLPSPAPTLRPIKKRLAIGAERDVPFFWEGQHANTPLEHENEHDISQLYDNAEVEVEPIQAPKRLFSLPFAIKIWPLSLFSAKKKFQFPENGNKQEPKNSARLTPNVLLLLAGFLLAGGVVWNLQRVGKGVSALSNVEGSANKAYGKIISAQAAFAATDFASGEQNLADAQALLSSARQEMSQALSASEYILKVVDVTNTVASGDKLLNMGEELTLAGQGIARGASAFLAVDVLADEKNKPMSTPHTLVDALSFANDQFKVASTHLDTAQALAEDIHSPFLPKEANEKLATLKLATAKVNTFLKQFDQQSVTLLNLFGADRQRQYLVVFANNDELRPVGGFIGSIGLINVDKGQVENIDVNSVYDGDGQLKEFIAPPDPLLPITQRWYLRDANWFVDYPTSAKKIADFFEKEGGPTVDGVIMMTPDVMKRLLTVTGPIAMDRYGVTVSADNFSVVTQGQVTYQYDKKENKPKQFLADLTPVLLNRLLSDNKSHLAVVSALEQAVKQKELLLFFRDANAEDSLQTAGWAGALPEKAAGYLLVNNANIGGHKSDQFITQEIDYRLKVSEQGQTEATVTVRRTHHGPEEAIHFPYPPGEDPSKKDNVIFQRTLVPLGSALLEAKGFTASADVPKVVLSDPAISLTPDNDVAKWQTSQTHDASGTIIGEEHSYTMFANWIITKPGETTITVYRYRLPGKTSLPNLIATADRATVWVGKQPGSKRTTLRVSLELPESTHIIHVVPSEGITQENDHSIVYRGAQQTDTFVGAAFTSR